MHKKATGGRLGSKQGASKGQAGGQAKNLKLSLVSKFVFKTIHFIQGAANSKISAHICSRCYFIIALFWCINYVIFIV